MSNKSPEIIIENFEIFSESELISRLQRLTLLEDVGIRPYENAYISCEKIAIEDIYPHQRYLLLNQIEVLRELKWELEKHDIDIFNIDGFVRMKIAGKSDPIDLLPPIVEELIEKNGRIVHILNDGMHRIYISRLEWKTPKVVFIRGIPKNLPFYAYPIPNQDWSQIEVLDRDIVEIPGQLLKKWHRTKLNKKLYRNFNSVFKNVGMPRKIQNL